VCNSPNLPGIAFFSSSDLTRDFPVPIRCTRAEKPIGGSLQSWISFWKIIRLIGF
jgi:hypothetical protein